MKNTDELMATLCEDIDKREAIVREQAQELERKKQAVAKADEKMVAALAAEDSKAYHEAEGEAAYARKALAAAEFTNPWWTQEEATELVKTMYEECGYECREMLVEVQSLLYAAMGALRERNRLAAVWEQYNRCITARVRPSRSFGIGYELEAERALQSLITRLENKNGMKPLGA